MARAKPAPGSLWCVTGSGNVYELVRKEPPFDYVLRLVELGPKADRRYSVGDRITVTFDWFGERGKRVAGAIESAAVRS
jgi:hypothetical protein